MKIESNIKDYTKTELQKIILQISIDSINIIANNLSQKNILYDNICYIKEILKNYFILKAYIENAVTNSQQSKKFNNIFGEENLIILNSVMEDVERTKSLISHLEYSLNTLKSICMINNEKKLQYKVFEEVYLKPIKSNYENLSKKYNVSTSKVKDFISLSLKELSYIFFIDFESNLTIS